MFLLTQQGLDMNDFISYTIDLMGGEVLINGFYLELWPLKGFLAIKISRSISIVLNTFTRGEGNAQ